MLVEKLTQIQTERGLSDRAFARELGISGVAWLQIRKGDLGMGPKALRGVRTAFPHLAGDILDYATRDHARKPAQKRSQA